MPDWTAYYIDYSPSDEERTALGIDLQRQWDRVVRERYQQEHAYYEAMSGQYYGKDKQNQEDRERYPLFFLKEGIV